MVAGRARELAPLWRELQPMDRLVVFKLLPPPQALELYGLLPPPERFLLLCARDLDSIAPALEGLPAEQRALFEELPEPAFERMLSAF